MNQSDRNAFSVEIHRRARPCCESAGFRLARRLRRRTTVLQPYDANGNQTSGTGRTLTWTAWNMPTTLSQGGQNQSCLYTPEHERHKLVAPGRTTLHVNPGVAAVTGVGGDR